LKVIYLLTKTRKPVSCDILADFAEEDALDVQEVLDDWEQFLAATATLPQITVFITRVSKDFCTAKMWCRSWGVAAGYRNGNF
jgi:hypothetical protein